MKTLPLLIAFFVAATLPAENLPTPKPKPKVTPEIRKAEQPGDQALKTTVEHPVAVSTVAPAALLNFEFYPPQIQQLVREAMALTELNLRYAFGSSDPKSGGMDCSGTIYHLLRGVGLKEVPRQSDEICEWVQRSTLLHRTTMADSLDHVEFAALQPGDLIFWSGTYETSERKLPVSHVMLYLGKLKKSNLPVVFGASDGRYYQGERRNGVSVFDLSVPKAGSKSRIYGYGLIPGIGRVTVK